MRFDGRIILITGAASGIGLDLAHRFLAEGATVIGTDINPEALANASQGQQSFVARISDAGNPVAIAELAQWVQAEYGALDILVNNAGFCSSQQS